MTLFDGAFTEAFVYVDQTLWVQVVADPAVAAYGFCDVYVFRLSAGVAVPAITGPVLEQMDEDNWFQTHVPYGQGSVASSVLRTQSKRAFKRGERIVIVARFNQNLAPSAVAVQVEGLFMRVDA